MWTKPKRNSFTRVGEKRCVSLAVKNRPFRGRSYGKLRSVALMLLERVPPREAWRPPAPKGRTDSELEKKNRAATLSWPPRNSRSQLVVNWSSLYFPGLLIMKVPVPPAVPGIVGIRNPPGLLPNWSLLKFKRASTTGSISAAVRGKAEVLNAVAIEAASRMGGSTGNAELLICVPGERALRWRVPW